MKPDNKAVPLAIALTMGMLANIVAVAVTRPTMPELPQGLDHIEIDPMHPDLLQLRYIANIGAVSDPGFSASWPTWRRSRNIEDCRPQPNRSFRPCKPI